MATQGFTVDDLLIRLNLKLRRHAGALHKADKIAAVDEGQQEVWRTLLKAHSAWFVVESQSTTSGNDDFFAKLTPSTTVYDLPKNFYAMYHIDVVESGQEDVQFLAAFMTSDTFKKKARSTTATPSAEKEFYYDVIGVNPARFVMPQPIPSTITTMELRLYYVKMLDRLTAGADSIDNTMLPFIGALSDYAAELLLCGVGDYDAAVKFHEQWAAKRDDLPAVANRLLADPALISAASPLLGRVQADRGRI